MGVPADIRAVQRPKNTIVDDNGNDSVLRYAVRVRGKIKCVPGGNPQPSNGKVIGHIIDHKYVPLTTTTKPKQIFPDTLQYGASALVKSVTRDIQEDLLKVYDPKTVYSILAIATLRVIKPSIAANRYSTHYNRSFVCIDYPGVGMSSNTISKLLQYLGKDGNSRKEFYKLRIDRTSAGHHIAIDETLKQDNSTVNDLSAFSRKARVRGCQEVSIIYAYNIELMEPICSEVFPGNCIDASAYPAFIRDNNITKGILVDDKGFPPSKIMKELAERPDLHFLTPIKRNDSRIKDNDMLAFEGIIEGIADHVLYKKKKIKGGRFLYAFKNMSTASHEEYSYLDKQQKNNSFSSEKYEHKKDEFGVIVLESDQDLDPKVAYKCYDDRWLIELVFDKYKNDECLDKTNCQGDFSVIGSEFINFISTIATCRIVRKAEENNLLDDMSYSELMDDLCSAWRMVGAPEPVTEDEYWVHTLKSVFVELEKLGLTKPLPKEEPKKRGRKPKPKDPNKQEIKRPRGRPRKNQTVSND